jgi:hypothetical protein
MALAASVHAWGAPGSINYSYGDSGNPQHLTMALLATRAGLTTPPVPNKSADPKTRYKLVALDLTLHGPSAQEHGAAAKEQSTCKAN